jgi:hypothetical protein
MRRWFKRLTPPWGAMARRARLLAQAERQQDDEHKAAMQRIADAARDWDGPTWGGPIYRAHP